MTSTWITIITHPVEGTASSEMRIDARGIEAYRLARHPDDLNHVPSLCTQLVLRGFGSVYAQGDITEQLDEFFRPFKKLEAAP